MCEQCLEQAEKIRIVTDAIDNNREAFSALMLKIYAEMDGKLFKLLPMNVGGAKQVEHLTMLLVANFVTTFLSNELPLEDDQANMFGHIHHTALGMVETYTKARKLKAN